LQTEVAVGSGQAELQTHEAANDATVLAEAQAAAEAAKQEQARLAAEAKAREEAKAKAEAAAREKARLAAEAKAREEAKAKAEAAAQEKARLATEAKIRAALEAEMRAEAAAKAKAEQSAQPSLQELQDLIKRLQQAYRQGDIKAFSALFSPSARSNERTSLAGIRSDYEQLFASTQARDLRMTSMVWEKEKDYARGLGEYEVTVQPKGEGQGSISQGEVTIQVERRASGGLQITRFYFEAITPPVQDKEALAALMQSFRQAYEQGDIEQFMALFASDAQTNNQASVAGIRKDYLDLFKNTAQRSLELTGMKWLFDGNKARGEAKYTVSIRTQPNQETPSMYEGTLWIEVENRAGGLKVTHFAFVE
jgi:hypothetical protein